MSPWQAAGMVGSIKQISQDLATLDKAVAEMAEELHNTYSSYLNLLGQAVRQQLILASYHVCTQGYPEEFLSLPYHQRQQLQQLLKNLAHQVQEELLAQLHVPTIRLADLEPEVPELDAEFSLAEPVAGLPEPASDRVPRSLTPLDLARWQQDLEQAIGQELRTASHAANRLLQQAKVLPHQLPEPLLEAAIRGEMAEMGSKTPNLLNLLVETTEPNAEASNAEADREHAVMHIVAIYLRLGEIEFADAPLTAMRNKIRSLIARLKNLGREYHRKQRERTIAEAQAAWRASWFEEA